MDCGDGWSSPPFASPDTLPRQGSSDSERRSPYHPPTQRVLEKGLEDVVMMNVDSNILETPFDDVQTLPPDVVSVTPPTLPCVGEAKAPNPPAQPGSFVLQVSLLRLRLRKVALIPGEGVSRLFLKAQALLFGGYRDALVCSPVSSQDAEEASWTLKDNIDTYIYSGLALCLRLLICKMRSRYHPYERMV